MKGFTLIEVLIAAVILITISFSFTYLLTSGIKSIDNSKDLLMAINLAQSQMEEVRALPFDNITSIGSIVVRPISYDLLEIRLSLDWKAGKHPIELITMRSKYL
jgi:type II secretory pathway pseudopilin PulG